MSWHAVRFGNQVDCVFTGLHKCSPLQVVARFPPGLAMPKFIRQHRSFVQCGRFQAISVSILRKACQNSETVFQMNITQSTRKSLPRDPVIERAPTS